MKQQSTKGQGAGSEARSLTGLRLESLFEFCSDAIVLTNSDGTIDDVNPAAVSLLGFSRDQLAGRNIDEFFLSSPLVQPSSSKAEGSLCSCDLRGVHRRRDGSLRECRLTVQSFRGVDGYSLGHQVIIKPIAGSIRRRWRGYDALSLRFLIEHSEDLVSIVDEGGTIRYESPSASRFLGYETAEIVGKKALDFVHPEDQSHLERLLDEAVASSRISARAEYRVRHKNGSWRHLETMAQNLLRLPRFSGIVLGSRDITDRRRAEEEAHRLLQAVENANDVIFMTRPDGTINYVNPAFQGVYGYSKAEAMGKTPRLLKGRSLTPEQYGELWKRLLSGESVYQEFLNKTKDGRLVNILSSISPVYNAAERLSGFIAVQRDITGQKQLEAQFLHSQKMEAVGRLAGGVAHDFNNLLTIIQSASEFLIDELEGSQKTDAEEINLAAQRAASLTGQLLAFSRRQMLVPKVLDLNEIVVGTEKMLRRLIGEDIQFTVSLARDLGRIKADPGQIEQILMNLAVNARDAMPHGGELAMRTEKLEICTREESERRELPLGTYTTLSVSDTGTGMSPETMERIFEPFFTTKDRLGTGLGLSTTYGIVRQSGGQVSVESQPGRGTTFKLFFPQVIPPQGSRDEANGSPVERTAPATVLLVEEDEDVRCIALRVLASKDFTVLEAKNEREAARILDTTPDRLDLVLTDWVMPAEEGCQLGQRILDKYPGLPVILMSGYPGDAVGSPVSERKNFFFLEKPFSPESLTKTVRQALDLRPRGRGQA